MMDRRTLLATASAAFTATVSKHSLAQSWGYDPNNMAMTAAQKKAHFARFPTLDSESIMSFAGGFKRWQGEYRNRDTYRRRAQFVRSLGYPPGPTDLDFEACHNILLQDPTYQAEIRLARSIQELMWDRALSALYADEDLYLSAMEATDNAGPGSLELNPSMVIPEYTTYEIHQQPGGYVGHQFAGWLYHYALALSFYQGLFSGPVRHDEPHHAIAARTPVPSDGRVRRILEAGCSDGRTTIALKERFPDAEVWGIDVGGPMVRYAHHRAAGMGHDIYYAQRLAEDTQFPDNHFDIIVTNLLFHEVESPAISKIVPEFHRIMRRGGIWDLTDGPGGPGHPKLSRPMTITTKAARWVNHRYNNETWEIDWAGVNMTKRVQDAGFHMDLDRTQMAPVKV